MAVPNIHIMPLKQFLRITQFPKGAVALLSSSEPIDGELVRIPFVSACYQDLDYEDPRAFLPDQAKAFADFIRSVERDASDIYICCQAGESRSPGIAAAVGHYFGIDPLVIFQNPKYHPNVLCFRLLAEALSVPVDDEVTDLLIYENNRAFQEAIQRARR